MTSDPRSSAIQSAHASAHSLHQLASIAGGSITRRRRPRRQRRRKQQHQIQSKKRYKSKQKKEKKVRFMIGGTPLTPLPYQSLNPLNLTQTNQQIASLDAQSKAFA